MKPPWLASSQESAELEALQADVMRFVAILGLCLAAIFSLVHSAAVEQRDAEHARAGEASLRAEERPPSTRAEVVNKTIEADVPEDTSQSRVKETADAGFTLEFLSATALDRLVDHGTVQLFVEIEETFYRFSSEGIFSQSAAPNQYYLMDEETVPAAYVKAVSLKVGGGQAVWAVSLPADITEQVVRLTREKQKGSLVIDETGEVSVYD